MFKLRKILRRTSDSIPIFDAITARRTNDIEDLLHNGEDPNEISRERLSPLCLACKLQNIDAVRLLVEHGADVNIFIKKGISCLAVAASNGNLEIAELLINLGANIEGIASRGQNCGWNPLQYAVLYGRNVSVVRLLLESGATTHRLEKEFDGMFFRVPGDILRYLQTKGVQFSDDICHLLEQQLAVGDEREAPRESGE